MDCCCLPLERAELTVNSKKETHSRVKMGQRVKMGYCCLPLEGVELTVSSKKETIGRVRLGQESKWAAVVEIGC